VVHHDAFDPEFDAMPREARIALLAATGLLEIYGPTLGRPYVDTLKGSKHANMKELRFEAGGGVWIGQPRFYKALIARADRRFSEHLKTLRAL
jgi:hypothetical protein